MTDKQALTQLLQEMKEEIEFYRSCWSPWDEDDSGPGRAMVKLEELFEKILDQFAKMIQDE